VTTTSGAVTITLPTISTVSDGFKVAIVKWTGDANAVTVARSSTNTINGATSVTIGAQYSSTIFVADFETNQWFAASSGLGATNIAVDAFSGNNSTVAFTLSGDPGSENNTQVYVSGVYQEKDTYSVSGTTLTFSTAPPTGTSNIEVVWTAPLAIGTPSDGTVTTAKLASTTGSGAVVLAISPTITTPTLTTPTLTSPTISGTPAGVGVLTSGTAVSSTTGTSIDLTSIPSWVKRITVLFNGVSKSGTANFRVRLGTGGSPTTTGYTTAANIVTTGASACSASTAGFDTTGDAIGTATVSGNLVFVNLSGNIWTCSSILHTPTPTVGNIFIAGIVSLAGTLDMVRITTTNGTDTFDAGSINIFSE
jgi:hypothetical protein